MKQASVNRAGSCAIVSMIIDDDIYMINVGDSRAVMSKNGGTDFGALTRDHKPMD
jgi:serine/threonine protein phosphatase PrpC